MMPNSDCPAECALPREKMQCPRTTSWLQLSNWMGGGIYSGRALIAIASGYAPGCAPAAR